MNIIRKTRPALAAFLSMSLLVSAATVSFSSAAVEYSANNSNGTEISIPAQDLFSAAGSDTALEGSGISVDSAALAAPPPAAESEAESGFFHDTFEGSSGGWKGRGGAKTDISDGFVYSGSGALKVTGRTDSWNGAERAFSTEDLVPGKEYSFSVCAGTDSGTGTVHFLLSLQYTSSEDKTVYDHIAEADAVSGKYVQLANTNYTVPQGASELILYVETSSGSGDFCIDEAVIAEAGTEISGPKPYKFILGDLNLDGAVDTFDLVSSRRWLTAEKITDKLVKKAADVDQNGEVAIADTVLLQEFLLGRITEFPIGEKVRPEAKTMEEYTAEVEPDVVNIEPDSSHNEQPGVDYGTLKKGEYFSTTANKTKPYYILLPAGYDESKEYPVLYVMHGYYETEKRMIIEGNSKMYTREIIGNAIAAGEAEEMIVVFPYIFTSKTLNSATAMDNENNKAYDDFVYDLYDDLMPHIESTYSVKTGRENTAITGFSMGGRESLLIGLQHPETFGYVGAICPAPGVTDNVFVRHSDEESPYLLFLTAGTNDEIVRTVPSGYNDSLNNNGVPHIWHYVQGGYHGENCIHAHIYNFVRTLFKAA